MAITLSPTLARRLAITRQRLAGPRPPATAAGIMDVIRDLGCLQLDPINVVARSHQLVLFSRLGAYDLAHLDALLWEERQLFEYWAHCASIVLTEDYALHSLRMRNYGNSDESTSDWIEKNKTLRRRILTQLRRHGPLPSRHFEDKAVTDWYSSGWTSNRNVSQMLSYLWQKGQIMVAGRDGIQKLWDLTERCLPDWASHEELAEREVVRRSVEKSIRGLGVGAARHIAYHFTRGRYPGLKNVLAELEVEDKIKRVALKGHPGIWYLHTDDLPLLDQLSNGQWHASRRTALLSPFDNLICDRARTEQLFNFNFRIEIYTPKAKRKYGYYVLPILHGDRIIGRVDPAMDRENERLTINAVYAEPGAPKSGKPVAEAVEELATFLGANEINYTKNVPEAWKRHLR